MKKIFLKFALLAISGVSVLNSCNLNLFPEASDVYDEKGDFFRVEGDVDGAHAAIYSYFRSTCGGAMAYSTDLMFQGFNATREFGNRNGDIHRTDGSFTTSNDVVEAYWGNHYVAINQYNIFIAAADAVEDESFYDKAQFVKAEALIARAYSYLQLARLFGPVYSDMSEDELRVPVVLKYEQNARPKRDTNKQVYDQIAADLDEAQSIFEKPEIAKFLTAPVPCAVYFTVDVIDFIRARMLLDIGEYEDAADVAKKLINKGVYSLSSNQEELKKVYLEDAGKEAIMQCYAGQKEGVKSYSIFMGYAADDFSPNGYSFCPDFLPSKVLIDSYDAGDLRRLNWFELTGTATGMAPFILIRGQKDWVSGVSIFTKYRGNKSLIVSGEQNGQTCAKPFMLSELYLVAAEALYNAGSSEAVEWLNKLQVKRKAALTGSMSIDALDKEWFRETIGDGLYMGFLKRNERGFNGREGQAIAVSKDMLSSGSSYMDKEIESDDKVFVWPIPEYEMRCNKNLKQNDAWK